MMKNAGADDVIKCLSQLLHVQQRKLAKYEITDLVLFLKLKCVSEAGLADVDGRDASVGLAQCVACSLRGPATCDQDLLIWAGPPSRPDQMKQSPATPGISVQLTVFVQAGERRRIRLSLVKIAELRRSAV